jgi:hypothetical protein
MLRKGLMVFAALLILAGLFASVAGAPQGFVMVLWGCILLAAVMFERWRYGNKDGGRGSTWQDTGERFVDPESGLLTKVMYNAKTGDRKYWPVVDEERPS